MSTKLILHLLNLTATLHGPKGRPIFSVFM